MDRNLDGLEDTKQRLVALHSNADVLLQGLDVTAEEEVIRSMNTIQEYFGRIDFVVQCAGLNQQPRAPSHQTEMANFDKVVNVNYRALFMVQRECVRKMLVQDRYVPLSHVLLGKRLIVAFRRGKYGSRGSIVNISSVAAYKGLPNMTPVWLLDY